MNNTTPLNLMEPMMTSATQFNGQFLAAAEHLRQCCREAADTATADYKQLFERLQKASDPQQTMSIVQGHFQTRFVHTIKSWHEMQIAMTDSQHALTRSMHYHQTVTADPKGKHPNGETPSFIGAVSSAFNHMAEMTQDMLASEVEREIDETTPHKTGAQKHTKSHPAHHANGIA